MNTHVCGLFFSLGAFMDCGLERDVLLPFKEQTAKVEAGKSYLVRMYVDKSGRPAVSMKIGKELQPIEGYEEGQDFVGTVYEFKKDFAVIKSYKGVLPFTDKADKDIIKKEFGLSKKRV